MILINSKKQKERKLYLFSVINFYLNLTIIYYLGSLYPSITQNLLKVNTFEGLKDCLGPYLVFTEILRDAPDPKKLDEINIQSGLKTLGN